MRNNRKLQPGKIALCAEPKCIMPVMYGLTDLCKCGLFFCPRHKHGRKSKEHAKRHKK